MNLPNVSITINSSPLYGTSYDIFCEIFLKGVNINDALTFARTSKAANEWLNYVPDNAHKKSLLQRMVARDERPLFDGDYLKHCKELCRRLLKTDLLTPDCVENFSDYEKYYIALNDPNFGALTASQQKEIKESIGLKQAFLLGFFQSYILITKPKFSIFKIVFGYFLPSISNCKNINEIERAGYVIQNLINCLSKITNCNQISQEAVAKFTQNCSSGFTQEGMDGIYINFLKELFLSEPQPVRGQ